MYTKFIFLLIFALFVKHSNTLRSYVSNNELKVNDERIGKDKRSSEDDPYSDDYFSTNIKKDLTDYDYKNGNVEPDTDDREADTLRNINKRETKVITDIQSFSDADIEQALSKLTEGELQVLENVMENEAPSSSNIKKRGIVDSDVGKFCDSPYGCNSKNSDTFDDGNYKSIITYEQLPGERPKTGKIFKRFSRFSPLSHDEIMQARIDFLKDNYKRQSEIGKIENSLKIKERYQRDVAKGIRNPYFNSLIGPRSRTKRSVENKLTIVNPMDDPKSIEHIKLLEESFPNPNLIDSSLHSDQPHIRVKRS